jgi:Dyp-type peroxidase family
VHVAFTHVGLEALGLTREELLAFPREFVHGMNHGLRAKVLGDTPSQWSFGGPQHPAIDAVVLLYARSTGERDALVAEHERGIEAAGARVVHRDDDVEILDKTHEHFGFHDGISEPHVSNGPRTKDTSPQASLAPGELLVGHLDEYGQTNPAPVLRGFDVGTNGTNVVYRKLEQRVHAFWRAMRQRARERPGESEQQAAVRLAASLVGRWPGGAPLVDHPDRDPGIETSTNDFLYAEKDPHGTRCPIGAHARRAYPRDMLPPAQQDSLTETSRHRLFRRGRPYGKPVTKPPWTLTDADPDDDAEGKRGLVFIALCGSLRRQFEFIQQTWVLSTKFAGLLDERDPMIGGGGRFTLQRHPVRRCLVELPSFVEMRGGAYFFMPGLCALEWLGTLNAK